MKDQPPIIYRNGVNEVVKLGRSALLIFFIMEIMLCVLFKLPDNYSLSSGLKMLMSFGITGQRAHIGSRNRISNFTTAESESYELNGDIRIHSPSATIFVASGSHVSGNMSSSWITGAYARRYNNFKVQPVRDWTVLVPLSENEFPVCDRKFDNIPAVMFSAAGYSPNYFHSFADILVPLYMTSRQYNTEVIFLITGYARFWEAKYKPILEKLTKYEIVDIDSTEQVLCFSKAVIGLRKNREFGIDPDEPPYYSMKDFRKFIRGVYSLKRDTVKSGDMNRKPRMLMISRGKTRHLINEKDIVDMAEKLGFEVDVQDTNWNIPLIAEAVNSADVFLGVHGAGLTNMIFLPDNSIVIQIVPFGLEVPSVYLFGYPSQRMNFTYMHYRVRLNESSLYGKYPPDSQIYTDPFAVHNIQRVEWKVGHKIFFGQDLKIDLVRFRNVLLKAFQQCNMHA